MKDKLQRRVKKSVCKHCRLPIRLHRGVWVHDDPDEDPRAEDYGWAKCLPNEDGTFDCAEPNTELRGVKRTQKLIKKGKLK